MEVILKLVINLPRLFTKRGEIWITISSNKDKNQVREILVTYVFPIYPYIHFASRDDKKVKVIWTCISLLRSVYIMGLIDFNPSAVQNQSCSMG